MMIMPQLVVRESSGPCLNQNAVAVEGFPTEGIERAAKHLGDAMK